MTSGIPTLPPAVSVPCPGPGDASRDKVPRRIIGATVIGNALEFYDFGSYALFAVYIGKAFFPASTPMDSLLLSVAVFGVGFVARPLGGALIGAFADRAGRKPAMMLTIALITIGTLGLALTPSYASIGIAAPMIVVASRLIQGLALGGEVGPATAYLIEAAPAGRRGLYASFQVASQGLAGAVASTMGMAAAVLLTPTQMAGWGWRLPFAFGLLLVPLGIYLRRRMPETLHDESRPRMATSGRAARPERPPLSRYRGLIAVAVLIMIGITVPAYVLAYMTTYAITTLKMAPGAALSATLVVSCVGAGFSLLGGWLADRHGRLHTMLWPRVLTVLLAVPGFMLLAAHPSIWMLLAVSSALAALTAIHGAASIAAIPELLPAPLRALGLGIAYAVGVSLFGGSTQFIITWLLGITGNPAAPAWYMVGASAVSALALLGLPESRDRALEA